MNIEDRATLKRETRQFTVDIEVRDGAAGGLSFEGYATTYGTPYMVEDFLGSYEEEFVDGAFAKSLRMKADVPLLVNHAGLPLARTSSGTLDLTSTKTGLRARSDLEPLDPDVQAISWKMKRGDLSQMSIAFRVVEGGQEWSPDWSQRRITEAELYDVSIVTTPANPFTSAGLRSLDPATVDMDDLIALVAKCRGVDADGARAMLQPATVIEGPSLDELFLRHYDRRVALTI